MICHSLRARFNTEYRELKGEAFSHYPVTADFNKMQDVISQSFRGIPHKIYRGPTNKSIFNIFGPFTRMSCNNKYRLLAFLGARERQLCRLQTYSHFYDLGALPLKEEKWASDVTHSCLCA